ncbi:hypothetical protein H072_9661 [Dactylellina haptotyla CBS 200.50]|uniref:Clr5 domain-containing protein n=1 Tax=Dactylellina haptotyla (strain CBS 200.50) TaxID=1284197 RepID=S8A6Q5_DACHA|nr:hypothetical protein H072_9661 [Dactylellina haptotyla CBS 200.50]
MQYSPYGPHPYKKLKDIAVHKDFILEKFNAGAKQGSILAALRTKKGITLREFQLKRALEKWGASHKNLTKKRQFHIWNILHGHRRNKPAHKVRLRRSGRVLSRYDIEEIKQKPLSYFEGTKPSPGDIILSTPSPCMSTCQMDDNYPCDLIQAVTISDNHCEEYVPYEQTDSTEFEAIKELSDLISRGFDNFLQAEQAINGPEDYSSDRCPQIQQTRERIPYYDLRNMAGAHPEVAKLDQSYPLLAQYAQLNEHHLHQVLEPWKNSAQKIFLLVETTAASLGISEKKAGKLFDKAAGMSQDSIYLDPLPYDIYKQIAEGDSIAGFKAAKLFPKAKKNYPA